jgi:hypothetical protein
VIEQTLESFYFEERVEIERRGEERARERGDRDRERESERVK